LSDSEGVGESVKELKELKKERRIKKKPRRTRQSERKGRGRFAAAFFATFFSFDFDHCWNAIDSRNF
jgi:hypothetical protein